MLEEAHFSATSRASSPGQLMDTSAFGAHLMEYKQRGTMIDMTTLLELCVTYEFILSLIYVAMQASSLSYHAASGNIVVGHNDGKMGLWQTAAYVPSDVSIALPSHGCVRARLRIAQAQVDAIDVLLGQAENGSRQQISGEPELKSSIDDLEANKCTHLLDHMSILLNMSSGEREEITRRTKNCRG